MDTDKRTIKDTMVFILIVELNNMEQNDARYGTERDISKHRFVIGDLGVSSQYPLLLLWAQQ